MRNGRFPPRNYAILAEILNYNQASGLNASYFSGYTPSEAKLVRRHVRDFLSEFCFTFENEILVGEYRIDLPRNVVYGIHPLAYKELYLMMLYLFGFITKSPGKEEAVLLLRKTCIINDIDTALLDEFCNEYFTPESCYRK